MAIPEILKPPKEYIKMKSFNLSGKIDPELADILEIIVSKSQNFEIQFMVVGATARDLLFALYGINPYRMTLDIDIGVKLGVNGWGRFEMLKSALLASGKFQPTKDIHKIAYGNEKAKLREVDILPFGEISSPREEIRWPPPNDDTLFNVSGFQETFLNCEILKVRENPDLEIKVASLPSQFVLKLLAWKDRGASSDKDAKDIFILVKNYGHPINEKRLFEEETDILSTEDFDVEMAGACLLGRDVRKVVSAQRRDNLQNILQQEVSELGNNKLAQSMMSQAVFSEDFEKNILFLQKILAGLLAE
jgi:predicted nucleotidyltransferase